MGGTAIISFKRVVGMRPQPDLKSSRRCIGSLERQGGLLEERLQMPELLRYVRQKDDEFQLGRWIPRSDKSSNCYNELLLRWAATCSKERAISCLSVLLFHISYSRQFCIRIAQQGARNPIILRRGYVVL